MEKQRVYARRVYLIVNFGGPRSLEEIEEFMICLFRDQEVLRTPFPAFIHNLLFTRLAKARSQQVRSDYARIGNKSPIYEDTEAIARKVARLIDAPVLTFHRYLPSTHASFIEAMSHIPEGVEIRIFPLFPQFSYATTGSIAKWFTQHFKKKTLERMRWIKSYPLDGGYISAFENGIREFLIENALSEAKTILLFSAHGVPKEFIDSGDVYEEECQLTFQRLAEMFPAAKSYLCYQSQFGKKEWIRPYTSEICRSIDQWGGDYDNAVVIPLSFTSDHIETLFEIEQQYLPVLKARGFHALRCPALNQKEQWLNAIADIMKKTEGTFTQMLLRK